VVEAATKCGIVTSGDLDVSIADGIRGAERGANDHRSRATPGRIPAIQAFAAVHQLADVTVIADAGMISAGNQKAIEDAVLSFHPRARISDVPYVVAQCHREHPEQELSDGQPPRPWHLLPVQG
jgi:hypothetical protein